MLKKLILIGILALTITGCSDMNLKDFAEKKPEFKIEEYFLGKTSANGLFIDRLGKVRRQFTVDMEGIHCLLYTSPSPRDATLSRMPSSA